MFEKLFKKVSVKKVILLGAGLYYVQTIRELVDAGFYIIALDRDNDALGKKFAHEFYPIDIVDENAVLELAKIREVDGVMNVNEFGSRTACYVSQQLGLPGHSKETVEATNDKGLMRDLWKMDSLSMPNYYVFSSKEELNVAIKKIGFPCVLKPTDSGGSGRGVSILRDNADKDWAYDFAKQFARNGRLILEEFIEGTELTIETFSINEKVNILAISDKIKPEIKTRVATSLNYPAKISEEVKKVVEELVSKAILSLGVKDGICHTEVIVNMEGIPYLVETGARGGGGHIFHTIIKNVSGINAPVIQAKWLVGDVVSIDNIMSNGCCYRFFNPPKGILKAVQNFDEASKVAGVLDIGIVKKSGELVGDLQNSLQRAGFVVTNGKTREEAIAIADSVESMIRFIVEPLNEGHEIN